MNEKNLIQLQQEMEKLGFGKELITKMESHIKSNEPIFQLHDQVSASRGQVDITLHFKQSGQSEYYYLNRMEATHHQAKPLEKGQKWMVISKGIDEHAHAVKTLESFSSAVDYFKKQTWNAELAAGKSALDRTVFVAMEGGKITQVAPEFRRDFYTAASPQHFWLDRGKGFTREQAANLVQGRAVYRNDLLSRAGHPYKAWMQLDTDKERDRHQNLGFKQFTEGYGYDIKAVLQQYNIKELAEPDKGAAVEQILLNGGRPLVTVQKDGTETKMFLETAVRYGNLNFFAENGRPEKREQFLKEAGMELAGRFSKNQGREKDSKLSQEQGLGV